MAIFAYPDVGQNETFSRTMGVGTRGDHTGKPEHIANESNVSAACTRHPAPTAS